MRVGPKIKKIQNPTEKDQGMKNQSETLSLVRKEIGQIEKGGAVEVENKTALENHEVPC